MAGALDQAVYTLQQFGLMDVFVPFMLVFTLVYAILYKIQIFGEGAEKNRYYAIIALAIALGVIIPHSTGIYSYGNDPVVIINSSLPSIAAVMVALISVLILIGAFGWKFLGGEIFKVIFGLIAFGTVLYVFGTSAGWFPYGYSASLDYYIPPEVQSLIIILLVFGLIVYFIIGGEVKTDVWGNIKGALNEFQVGEGKKKP